jgi:hypothetical protein
MAARISPTNPRPEIDTRQELFCRLIAEGRSQYESYTEVGYKATTRGRRCRGLQTSKGPAPAAERAALLPVGDPMDDPAKLYAAIDAMRAQGLNSVGIIDGLIGSYCPIVAENTSLTVPQKTSRVQKFAVRITRARLFPRSRR